MAHEAGRGGLLNNGLSLSCVEDTGTDLHLGSVVSVWKYCSTYRIKNKNQLVRNILNNRFDEKINVYITTQVTDLNVPISPFI